MCWLTSGPMTVGRFFVVAVIAGAGVALLPYIIFPHPRQKPFDQAEWARLSGGGQGVGDKGDKSKRGAMADDLVKNHLKKGLSIPMVTSLLGSPDTEAKDRCHSYYLGWYKSVMDTESLVACFDKDGNLTETYIWQH